MKVQKKKCIINILLLTYCSRECACIGRLPGFYPQCSAGGESCGKWYRSYGYGSLRSRNMAARGYLHEAPLHNEPHMLLGGKDSPRLFCTLFLQRDQCFLRICRYALFCTLLTDIVKELLDFFECVKTHTHLAILYHADCIFNRLPYSMGDWNVHV